MAISRVAMLSAAVLLLLVTAALGQKDNVPSTPTNANTGGDSGSSVDHVPGTATNAGGGTPAPASSKDNVPSTPTNAGDNKDSGTSTDHVPGTKTNAGGGSNAAVGHQVPVMMGKVLAAAGVFGLMLF
jgi:hypothetical protein